MNEPAILPAPYRTPPSAHALLPSPATHALVETQVRALLSSSPAYHALEEGTRTQIEADLTRISAYTAELVREDLYQSLRLGQRPVLVEQAALEGPGLPRAASPSEPGQKLARAQETFTPSAANQVGRVTGETLRALSFPTFVADLIRGTFQAIVNASIQQMEAYGQLLRNVAMTVDQFMAENISDNQARDWLTQQYPDHITVRREGEGAVAGMKAGADDRPAPNFRAGLGLDSEVSLDDGTIEEVLVPAARRRLAQSRHRILSTMVLMGINRIVITGGKIRATMNFHIDANDALARQRASDLDVRVAASGSFGFGPWSASLSTSVAYVTSERSQSNSELNVAADLTSEVDLRFKSDYFPLERFVDREGINTIQGHTAVPTTNTPTADAMSPGAFPEPNPSPPPPRTPRLRADPLRPLGQMPAAPTAPTPPTPPSRSPVTGQHPPATGQPPATGHQPASGEHHAPETVQSPTSGERPAQHPTSGERPAATQNPTPTPSHGGSHALFDGRWP